MPVIPHLPNFLVDHKELHQFLWDCQQSLIGTEQTKIVSISLEIPLVDPLTVLQAISVDDRRHFYFERKDKEKAQLRHSEFAIAALDAAVYFIAEGPHRFSSAQDFIQSCLANTITLGNTHLPFSGPHFFCSFTFFDKSVQTSSDFPPATIFLPKLQITKHDNRCLLVTNTVIDPHLNIQKTADLIWQQIQRVRNLDKISVLPSLNSSSNYFSQTPLSSPNDFKKSVSFALDLIHRQDLKKIVLSHAIDVRSPTPFNLTASLHNLRTLYPDCYIFSISNGQGKKFIGASPERLISIHNQELLIDALAGTAPRGKTATEDIALANHLLASDKDLREHQVVVDFIIQRLSHLNLTPHFPPLPCLLQLSNIQHLWTPIKAKISTNLHLLEILAELHPTPAVAGVPREIAQEQIRCCERFDRSLYAAPLGWVDRNGNGEFAVGIRSALIEGDRARLYAGAGIVTGSEPDQELAEILLKFQALLNALV